MLILFVISVLAIIGGIIFAIFSKNEEWTGGIVGSVVAIVVGLILAFLACTASISTGKTGILTTFGRVENYTLDAGFHFKGPWQNVVEMNNQEQRLHFEFDAFSSDIQQVKVTGSINFNIDKATAMTLYKEVGMSYDKTLINPRLFENTKAVFSHYIAEELVAKRNVLSEEIYILMEDDLKGYGINVISVSVEDIDFTDAFTDAVEAKQVATQNKLKAETEQEQKVMEAQMDAERRKIEADAEAAVRKTKADAEAYEIKVKSDAEAEANTKIAESLSEELIEYKYANTWDGKLPDTFMGDSEAIPVIQTN